MHGSAFSLHFSSKWLRFWGKIYKEKSISCLEIFKREKGEEELVKEERNYVDGKHNTEQFFDSLV